MPVFNWTFCLVFIFYLSSTLEDLCVFIDVTEITTFAFVDAFSLMSNCRALLSLANHVLLHRFYVPA